MKEGAYLSEVVRKEQFQKGTMSLICAKTGQGKTTMATQTLPSLLEVSSLSRVLFLIDTNMGQEQLMKNDFFQEWGERQKNKIYLMNYHKFGKLLKNYEIWADMFDLIIADEFHNLYKYARIDQARMYKNNPDFSLETIAVMLSRESSSYKAMETLKRWSQTSDAYVVAMTATPEQFEKDKELTSYISVIQQKESLVAYEIFEKYSYTDVSKLLSENPENKRMIFAPTVTQASNFKEIIEENTNRKATILHSIKSKTNEMDDESLFTRHYLISEQSFPPEIDDIIMTEAYTTGWNLKDERVETIICHTGNQIIQKQFVGRARQDIQKVYIYDSKKAENEKRTKRNNKEISEKEWIVPKEYLNIPLDKKKKDSLILAIHFPKKWSSLKKYLIEHNYQIKDKNEKGVRFSIISL